MKNYFLISQAANGWIVRRDNSSLITDSDLPTTFVFNSMDKAADHIVDQVGETRSPVKAAPRKRAGGAIGKRKRQPKLPRRDSRGHFLPKGKPVSHF